MTLTRRRRPGEIRDAIISVLSDRFESATVSEIEKNVEERIGAISSSSIRSYLRLNTPELFARTDRASYVLKENLNAQLAFGDDSTRDTSPAYTYGNATLVQMNCLDWIKGRDNESVHAVVTDPPYGLFEYTPEQQAKLRNGKGGVWRIPPAFDGSKRSPLPRFTVLTPGDVKALEEFFFRWASLLLPKLVPGANVVIASNPLLSYAVAGALVRAGFERRGEIVRLTMTMRGGDRPKAAHEEFSGVSVMPRSMWEPWLIFRRPVDGRVQDNLRKWKTGGFRRLSADQPFGDVIESSPTRASERALAPHPSLKPQAFLRHIVRGVLPLGEGIVLDPFAGSGSTLAAAEAVGYESIGVEMDPHYFSIAKSAIQKLAKLV